MTSTAPPYTLIRPGGCKTYWIGGQRHSIIVGGEETAGRYSIVHSSMAVGVGASEHIHGVEAEAFYVLKGLFRFIVAEEVRELGPGDFLHVEPGLHYRFEVQPPDAGEVLVLYAPAGLEKFIAEVGIADSQDRRLSRKAVGESVASSDVMKRRAVDFGLTYTGRGQS